MKRFTFSLAAVLRSKEIMEQLHARELAQANAIYLAEHEKWKILLQQQDQSARLLAPYSEAGCTQRASQAQRMRTHVLALGEQAAHQEVKTQQLEKVVAEKREAAVVAAREKEILVRLEQKQFEEYQIEMNRADQGHLDEVAQRRHWHKLLGNE